MQIQEIDVFLQPDGAVKLEVRGVKGPHCFAVTAEVEKILGGQVVARGKTPEHDEQETQSLGDSVHLGH